VKLSIIIPFYNSEKHLNDCLNSICNQIKHEIEIILINDSSTDKSVQICKKFLKKYEFLKLINVKKNKGVSYCRNLGIKNSTGKYICFLDSDDKYIKGSIKIILQYINKFYKKEIFILRSQENNKKVIDKNQFFNVNTNDNKKDIINYIRNFNKFRATCWNFIVKKEFLISHNIQFKNIKVFEDQAFVSSILCFAKKYKIISKPVYAKNTAETDSLSKKTGYIVASSCAKTIYEISKIIYLKKNLLNKKKIKFLLSRLDFVIEQLLLNILVCKAHEIDNIAKYFVKKFLFISKLPKSYLKKRIIFLNKKKDIKKRLLKYKFKKNKILKNLFYKIRKNKVIIFCAGSYSEIVLKVLLNFGTKIDFICDNNFNYFGKKLYKRIVKNPKILEKKLYKFSNYKLLICNNEKSQFNIIKKQLTKMGIKNRNIIHASL
tara:strand:- start:2260 stop:3555 length:1296 start_codon:yes stop_codon:yes gene_type:complete